MTLAVHRRSALTILALLLLLGGLPGRCFALDLLKDVSKEQAKELGITVRLQPRPGDVRVQVDFKPAGPKKGFKYTYLDVIQGGKRQVMAYLMPFKPTPDSMYFECYLDPAAVPNATVTVTVWEDPLTGLGYRLKLGDFMEPPVARGPRPETVITEKPSEQTPARKPPGLVAGSALPTAATPREAGAEPAVPVAGEKPALFKVKDVTIEQFDQARRTITVSLGDGPLPVRLANLPLGQDVRIRVSLVFPGVVNNVPFDWERLKGLVGKRVSMLLRAESSRLSVDAIAVAND